MTVGVGLAAVNTGNNLLYLVLGLMLSLIILSGVLSDVVLARIGATRRLPTRVFAGAPCLVEIELRNGKPLLPSFSLAAGDVIEGEDLRARARKASDADRATYYLKIDAQSVQRAGYLRVPSRRGWLRLTHVRLSTRYPFGFFDKWRVIERADALLVYPAIVPVPDLERRLERLLGREDARAEVPRRERGHGVEVAGVRPYREGDEARAIHGRRSASLGTLVVRELEREPGRELAIVLDLDGRAQDDDHTERVVSRAASIALLAHARGAAIEVLAPGVRSPRVAAGAPLDPILAVLASITVLRGEAVPPARRDASVLVVGAPPGEGR